MSTSTSWSPEDGGARAAPGPPLVGAVLAAGRGRRMGEMSWLAKTLVPLAGPPPLQRQLELFDALGVARVVVVVGDRRDQVADYLATTGRLERGVELVEQRRATGSGDALLCLEEHVAGPFVLFLGDIVLEPADDLAPLVEPVESGACDATLAVVWETDEARLRRNFRVDVDPGDRVVGVVEKPPGGAPALKGCGLYGFSPAIFEAARRTPRRTVRDGRRDRGITDCIQTLIDLGRPVRAARVCRWDLNLNEARDLILGDEHVAALEGLRGTSSADDRKETDRWRRTTA